MRRTLRKGRGVADLGGTLLAYIAWKRAMEGKDMKEAEGFTLNAITNPHSADEYRINGVVPNMPWVRAYCERTASLAQRKPISGRWKRAGIVPSSYTIALAMGW
jgi:putative endopeptidase